MSTETLEMPITATDLEQIVASVFETMLNLEVQPTALTAPPDHRLTAMIQLTGPWRGAVMLETGLAESCQIGARFMSIPVPEAVTDDVRDVLGELVNMIGGNMKSVLGPTASLSIPFVTDGREPHATTRTKTRLERQKFLSDEGCFWVSRIAAPAEEPNGQPSAISRG